MRVNLYAEELTDKIVLIEKTVEDVTFYGLRFYLELPVTVPHHAADGALLGNTVHRGPFMHRPGDDDSSAVTFWHTDKGALTKMLSDALAKFG